MPPYRPVNRNLDRSQIMIYQNTGERCFIQTMFFGIRVVTVRPRAIQKHARFALETEG
jgi:hypothetical protein